MAAASVATAGGATAGKAAPTAKGAAVAAKTAAASVGGAPAASASIADDAPALVAAALGSGDANAGDGASDESAQGGPSTPDPGAPATPGDPAGPTLAAPFAPAPASADPPPAAPATVQSLAAAIVSKAGEKVSRFEVVLNPDGLGRVEVQLSIGAQGKLTAAMGFDSARGLAALQARAPELEGALRQAGFDVAAGALSFSQQPPQTGAGGSGADAWAGPGPQLRTAGRAGGASAFASADLDPFPPARGRRAVGGLDIRI